MWQRLWLVCINNKFVIRSEFTKKSEQHARTSCTYIHIYPSSCTQLELTEHRLKAKERISFINEGSETEETSWFAVSIIAVIQSLKNHIMGKKRTTQAQTEWKIKIKRATRLYFINLKGLLIKRVIFSILNIDHHHHHHHRHHYCINHTNHLHRTLVWLIDKFIK